MSHRIVVSPICAKRCPSCFVCSPNARPATLDEALAVKPESEELPVILGGGDATRWPYLYAFLKANAERPKPERVWVEAPAASFTPQLLKDLKQRGVDGVRVQIEALGAPMIKALGVGDGEKAIEDAEAVGLKTEARVCARPKTLPIIAPLARRLTPRLVWVEMLRQDWGHAFVTLPAEQLDKALEKAVNVKFGAHRVQGVGYLPPCSMPATWKYNNRMWQATFSDRAEPNNQLPICKDCVLNTRCQWSDPDALSDAVKAEAKPIRREPPVRRIVETPVPEIIVRKRPKIDVVCTEPWTTLEVAGHDGNAHQCGGNWTTKPLGNIHDNTLTEIWNNQNFQWARRLMGAKTTDDLCKPICTRLYDGVLHEDKYKIQAGSDVFVQNQLLVAEEIAERKEIMKGMPRHMTICPSSYCNYNCVFCDHGRRPRWDMPDRIWDELHLFLPTLKTLTLLGGEPFANHRVWEFLTDFDTNKYPDVRLDIFTNGALMTEKLLRRVKSSSLGEITISINSGDPDVYDKIERGDRKWQDVVNNIDALIRFRDEFQWWFGITVSLIVMRENAPTLLKFGQLAFERNLHVRLVGLLARDYEELNYYRNADEVREVVGHLDQFIEWAKRVGRPDYVAQAQGARDAVIGEGAKMSGVPVGKLVPLQIGSRQSAA